MEKGKIYRFDKELLNMHLKSEHEAVIDGKKTIVRLTEGDTELVKKNQPDYAQPKDFFVSNLQMVVEDETTQKWLESKPYFGKMIKIYDPVAETKKVNDAFDYAIDVAVKLMKLSDIEIRTAGYELYGNEALAQEMQSLKKRIREDLQEDPEKIDSVIESTDKNDKTFTAIAFVKNIIQERAGGTEVVWASNDQKIISVTKGTTPVEAMVDYYKTAEGKEVKQEIGFKIKDMAADKAVAKAEAKEGTKGKGGKATKPKAEPENAKEDDEDPNA